MRSFVDPSKENRDWGRVPSFLKARISELNLFSSVFVINVNRKKKRKKEAKARLGSNTKHQT